MQHQGFETYLPQYKKAASHRTAKRSPAANVATPSPLAAGSVTQVCGAQVVPEKARAAGATATPGAEFEHLFPRYVFFRPPHDQHSISSVRSTRGVLTVVSFGGELARIDDELITAIRSFEHERNQTSAAELSPFQPGRQVRMRDAALSGLTGLVKSVSSSRVGVLIELLGREKLVTLTHDRLELA
ncbi:MAG: transcriptional activator RfaH [Burkholderiales bacterium]|nr:MAG: transcriptional activator RfaH [Burkholderiales bacterium]